MFGWRARIGYVSPCPAEGEVLDFYRIAPPGVSLVITALSVQQIDTRSLAAALSGPLANAIRDLARDEVSCILLAGEPMVFMNGYGSEENLAAVAREITPLPFLHNLPCAVEALRALGIRKLALATPYSVRDTEGNDVTHDRWKAYLAGAGFEMVGFASLASPSNRDVGRLPQFAPYQTARQAFREAASPPDGIYIPCARWDAISNIARLENDLGIPVVTSMQALVWKALQVVGVREVQPGFGRLFDGWAQPA